MARSKKPKVVKKAKTKRSNAPAKVGKASPMQENTQALGYNQTLLNEIISNKSPSGATEYSILFNSVLSTLTPAIRTVYYGSGFSFGELLHSLYQRKRRYILAEEGVSDLVSFLENAGYANTTYHIFPDRIDIKFNGRSSIFLGASMHVFESGIIAGFLSAATHQHVRVEEIACTNSGSRICHFVSLAAPLPIQTPGKDTLKMFVDSIKANANTTNKPPEQNFSEEYLMLASSIITDPQYSSHIARIAHHIGREIGNELKNPSKIKRLERLFELLGLGKLKVSASASLNIELRLDRIKAKKGFVDISTAFLGGLLDSQLWGGSKLNVKGAKKDNSYVINVTKG